MILKDEERIAAHNAKLDNDTGVDQTMLLTEAFEKTQTDNVSTKTSH